MMMWLSFTGLMLTLSAGRGSQDYGCRSVSSDTGLLGSVGYVSKKSREAPPADVENELVRARDAARIRRTWLVVWNQSGLAFKSFPSLLLYRIHKYIFFKRFDYVNVHKP
jgi:hypothetical protein